MAQTERIAAQPPYNCTLVILDTAQRETQLSEGYLQALYDARGMERPEKLLSNEDWYLRLGYDVFHKDKSGIFAWTVPTTGEIFPIPIVWMKKEIVN